MSNPQFVPENGKPGTPMLIPHMILEQYALGQCGGRFSAASLFADISGFSAVTSVLMEQGTEAAESLAEIMLAIFDPLVQSIYAHGGMITTFAGDALTALFPHEAFETEEAAYRHALAAAVRIQEHMATHPERETLYGTFPFAIKLGLAGGEVEWGILKPAKGLDEMARAAYFFSGPAVDRAAAAEHHASSGDLVLDAGAHAALEPPARGRAGRRGRRPPTGGPRRTSCASPGGTWQPVLCPKPTGGLCPVAGPLPASTGRPPGDRQPPLDLTAPPTVV